jgi:hypothetical protein
LGQCFGAQRKYEQDKAQSAEPLMGKEFRHRSSSCKAISPILLTA